MVRSSRLPEGLADMLPGPELAAALASVDPNALNGHDLVELAPAYVKMISHLQAKLATVLNLIQHSPPGGADSPTERTKEPQGWAEIEIAAKLHWTAGKASYELRHAHHLRRLPAVHAALADGVVDVPRARIFVDALTCLEDEAAAQVAEQVIARGAGRLTTRQLSQRLRRAVIAHDPQAAARKQRERLSDRWVDAESRPEGTANLYGMNLPPERVHAIMERITAIAKTAKRQGDQRTVHQLRADVFCDLLAGTGIGATPPVPVTDPESPPANGAAERTEAVVPLPGPRRGVVELTAPLSTLIGLSQAPGTLAGWGPVIADIVRQVVAEDPTMQWRFTIYDDLTRDGQLAYHGITLARPVPSDGGVNGFSATDAAFLRARDRTCRGPQGCHRPASHCELDHTIAKVDGGGHERGNGGPLCKREHMFKHQSGASLRQPEPGVFEWTTPLGHRYTVRPEPCDEAERDPPARTDAAGHQ